MKVKINLKLLKPQQFENFYMKRKSKIGLNNSKFENFPSK
jgi:hypothetical protein